MKTNQHHTEPPRIYVACLAAYNNGILHGAWIEATDAWSMWEATRDKKPIITTEARVLGKVVGVFRKV